MQLGAAVGEKSESSTQLLALHVGKVQPYTRAGTTSAIGKHPVSSRLRVKTLGILGDEQADLRVHGGIDKAVHHYPFEHYATWRQQMSHPLLLSSGAFGENFSTLGWTEDTIHIGDIVQAGSAVLQVSQGRQPCWKLNDRFSEPKMASWLQSTGRTGWYYRVLEEGAVAAGDALILLERPYPEWPIGRLMDMLFRRTLDLELLSSAQELPLPPSWQKLIQNRLAKSEVESWKKRLDGPDGS
jgi:MOSC domain-containing protein YiiM